MYRGAGKSLARPGRKQATATEAFDFLYPIYNHIIGEILLLFMYITRQDQTKYSHHQTKYMGT
jgi:hypothetical protein